MAFLEWRAVTKEFDGSRALGGLSLTVEEGEILGILGPSGGGKSTLLRITAGLEGATSGEVLFKGRDFTGVPPHQRGFGLMFQDYCLFPHLDVQANIAFGLRMKRWSKERRHERVAQMLRLVRLEGFGHRNVLTLSGGEQQRIALARSLAPAPPLLMLDEPLGALDSSLRGTLLMELAQILQEVRVTVLYVTHDQDEAMTVAGRIALLDKGTLVQTGTPDELVRSPANSFVAAFLRLGAVVPGTPKQNEGAWWMETIIGSFPLTTRVTTRGKDPPPHGHWGQLLVRPEAVHFTERPGAVRVRARVLARLVRGTGTAARIALQGTDGSQHELECGCPLEAGNGRAAFGAQGTIDVWVDPGRCLALPA